MVISQNNETTLTNNRDLKAGQCQYHPIDIDKLIGKISYLEVSITSEGEN